jgi:putative transposase
MPKSNIAYKFRLYPNEEQEVMFAKTFGCCRKVYNLMLNDKITYYREHKENKIFTPAMYKEMYPYLKEVDSLALANEQMHLQTAFKNFYQRKDIGYPKYKSKKSERNTYTTNNVNSNIVIADKKIRLPKIGEVKARIHRKAPSTYLLKSVTISKARDCSYYASVLYEYEDEIIPTEHTFEHLGLDYTSDGLYTDSQGKSCEMPKFYREAEGRLCRQQRKLSKKTKGSKNYGKQKKRLASIAGHVSNQRKDFLHKRSAEMTNLYDLISVESLDLKEMSRHLKLGKSTFDNGYGMFCAMLAYKQKRKGHHLIKVDKYYPSSQMCSCGYQNPITKDLSIRTITCSKCGKTYDRDINAAINVDQKGLEMYMSA